MPGPAIIEERESTIIIGEDANGSVDEFGFVWITLNSEFGMRNAECEARKTEGGRFNERFQVSGVRKSMI